MIVVESDNQRSAKKIAEGFFHNFSLFKNPPLNEFHHHINALSENKTIE
jgi:hypothetical protein